MKIIVGLGNPGEVYQNTRHNLGFSFLEYLAQDLSVYFNKQKFQGLWTSSQSHGEKFILLKPVTFMNNSGECIKNFLHYFQIRTEDLLVVYDELALPLGRFRYRESGSSSGHNGVKNIIELLETSEFKRLRIGIGSKEKIIIRQWVLQKFSKHELEVLNQLFPFLAAGVKEWIKGNNFLSIMNKYNKKLKNEPNKF